MLSELLFNYLIVVTPSLIGAVSGFLIFQNNTGSVRVIMSLILAMLCPLIVSALMGLNDTLLELAFSRHYPKFAVGALVFLTALLIFIPKNLSPNILKEDVHSIHIGSLVPMLPLLLMFVTLTLILWSLPGSSWDGLTFWLTESKKMLNAASLTEYSNQYENRHPNTLILFRAWVAFWTHKTALSYSISLTNVILGLCFFLLIFFYAQSKLRSRYLSFLTTTVCVSVPLFENHLGLLGYSEAYLAALLLSGYISGDLYFNEKNCVLLIVSVACFILACFTRNSGFIYSSVCVISILVVYLIHRRRHLLLLSIASATVLTFFILLPIFSADYDYKTCRLAYSPKDDLLCIAGRNERIGDASTVEMLWNLGYAWFINQSYSVLGITFWLCSITCLFENFRHNPERTDLTMPWITMSLALLTVVMGGSQILDYIYVTGTPGSDTGLSRSFLPLLALAPLTIVSTLANLFASTPKPP